MPTDPFSHHISDLRALGGGRVWSLMVSLFGDLAQAPGSSIDGPVLSAIMNVLQVRPEAVRVALHRLRNDGWIMSQKSGRISRHSLTPKGLAESAAASPRIYAAPDTLGTEWQLVLTADGSPATESNMVQHGFTAVAPRVFVGPAALQAPGAALCLDGGDVPPWLRTQTAPEELRAPYAALAATLGRLQQDLGAPEDMTAIETAVLRTLIVHNWRRLVLKHPVLPQRLMAPDWPGHRCHLLVADLLDRFARPDVNDIVLAQAA